ncbi:MAG: hypothetical protein LHW45_00345 [Candidatus Cloacimonetes bacterium]|nr:hypothetical protein [Candidatus Cloacimonadota bacterium]MDY0366069.1 MBOAT family O-acyltransferase [Candidatus Syntrophosphaera sp.]
MQFTSIPFFLFLFAVVVLYYVLPKRYRNWLLLAASYYFYFSFKAEYLIILLGSTAFNYFTAKAMDNHPQRKKLLLGLALVFNIGLLFLFKYFNFFSDQLNALFRSASLDISIPKYSLILPIGISFYTFMALGYILDVYWGDIKHQRNYLTLSLYLAFFPQILCGPIGRAKNLFKQFTTEHLMAYDNFANGFRLILWGLFMKMVVADNIALYVDAIYGNIPMHSSLTLIVAALLYPFQLYTDFGGYTNIARGVAKLFGYDLMVNFRTPYVNSTSVTDYWRRNHISLTSWVREYVFFPFMGSSTSKPKVYLGILVMFLVMGFWHGAGWMFLIWGLIQSGYLIFEDATGLGRKKSANVIVNTLKRAATYLALAFGLMFFRLPSFKHMKEHIANTAKFSLNFYYGSATIFTYMSFGLSILVLFEILLNKKQFDEWIDSHRVITRWGTYLGLAVTILLIGNLESMAFIYEKF